VPLVVDVKAVVHGVVLELGYVSGYVDHGHSHHVSAPRERGGVPR
jgi:hypothetical protein